MDRSSNEPGHTAAVDAWLQAASQQDPAVDIVGLFGVAFETLWNRAVTTLGSVTLTAIAERVLYTATSRYSFLSTVNPRPNGDTRWKQNLHDRLNSIPRAVLVEGLRFMLIDLLTVVGRLTAEILSPDLHAGLREASTSSSEAHAAAGVHSLPAVVGGRSPS